jgi:hypothetical protein
MALHWAALSQLACGWGGCGGRAEAAAGVGLSVSSGPSRPPKMLAVWLLGDARKAGDRGAPASRAGTTWTRRRNGALAMNVEHATTPPHEADPS